MSCVQEALVCWGGLTKQLSLLTERTTQQKLPRSDINKAARILRLKYELPASVEEELELPAQ